MLNGHFALVHCQLMLASSRFSATRSIVWLTKQPTALPTVQSLSDTVRTQPGAKIQTLHHKLQRYTFNFVIVICLPALETRAEKTSACPLIVEAAVVWICLIAFLTALQFATFARLR